MKRKEEMVEPKALEEVNLDDLDDVSGGFLDMLLGGLFGGGMMGMGGFGMPFGMGNMFGGNVGGGGGVTNMAPDPSEQRMNNAMAAFMEKIKDDPDFWNRLNQKRRGRPF